MMSVNGLLLSQHNYYELPGFIPFFVPEIIFMLRQYILLKVVQYLLILYD